jgi:hypothetical protein
MSLEFLLFNFVARDHSTGHVVANMAVIKPNTGIVGDHIRCFHLGRAETRAD